MLSIYNVGRRERERQRTMERWQKPEAEKVGGGTVDQASRSSLDYNTPLRSIRGDATSAPSRYYKLSAELSRESLRIPGAVPFMWEQSPGRRKFPSALAPSIISTHNTTMKPQAGSIVPETTSALQPAVDPAKPSLATLFRQPSLLGVSRAIPAADDSWPDPPLSSAIPQILPPPAADRPRCSSARFCVMQRNMPPGTSFNNAALHTDNGDDDHVISEEAISDTLTATAGEGLSMDDSLGLSTGAFRPASTPSGARDFIMHRFLPAAHTIACESPQTPSRRFLPPVGIAAPCSPSTPARCNGSFRDYATISRPSPLQYASASSTPASNQRQVQRTGQFHTGSFPGGEQEEEEEEEDEDEEPPSTPKACGIFPFRITLTFNGGSSRRSLQTKHQPNKQQHQKKGSKSTNFAGSRMRIMDILHDDHSSSHDDEFPVDSLWSKQSDAEIREWTKMAVLEQAGLMPSLNHCGLRPSSDTYYRKRPNLHQLLTAPRGGSELYNQEASECGGYQDALSRFQSPSPSACHPNARAFRACNVQPPLVSSIAQRNRSFAGQLQGDMKTSRAIISTTEQHLLNGSLNYYNMHTSINKPQYQAQHVSPSAYHTPLSSHVDTFCQRCAYHECISNDSSSKGSCHEIQPVEKAGCNDTTTNAEQWDASNHLAPNTHIINNALFEHEDQETANPQCPASMFKIISEREPTYSPTSLNKGPSCNQAAGPGGGHVYKEISNVNGGHHVGKGDQYVSRGDQYLYKGSEGTFHSTNGNNHIIHGDLHGGDQWEHHIVSNGNHYHAVSNGSHKGDQYVMNNHHYSTRDDPHYGDNHMSKGAQYASKDDPHYLINGDNHMGKGVQSYASNCNNHLSNGDLYVSTGDMHGKMNSSLNFRTKSLLGSPPLPKSPTHSWLDRTMPLVASTNKGLGTSSRLSHMHKATTPGDDYAAHSKYGSKVKITQGLLDSTEASKWEALVKGSHLQPGHLRFSEELLHQSQSTMKVGSS